MAQERLCHADIDEENPSLKYPYNKVVPTSSNTAYFRYDGFSFFFSTAYHILFCNHLLNLI